MLTDDPAARPGALPAGAILPGHAAYDEHRRRSTG